MNHFFQAMTKMMVYCNIPLSKADNEHFREFVETWCDRKCPESLSLRKNYSCSIYVDPMTSIRFYLADEWVFFQVDEARICERRIYSIIVGRLNGERTKVLVLNVSGMDEAANNQSMIQFVDESLSLAWPERIPYDNIRLIISDDCDEVTSNNTPNYDAKHT